MVEWSPEQWGKEAPQATCKSLLGRGEGAAFIGTQEGLGDRFEAAFAPQTQFLFRLPLYKGWIGNG